jgi:hypothetical protein
VRAVGTSFGGRGKSWDDGARFDVDFIVVCSGYGAAPLSAIRPAEELAELS